MQTVNPKVIPTAPRAWREKREQAERLIASWQPKEMVKEKAEQHSLPDDVPAARKRRINNEMIEAARRPCPPDTKPGLQGIGLYTHVAGTVASSLVDKSETAPKFISISSEGGPQYGARLEGLISPEVQAVFRELRDAIDEEEQIIGHKSMTVEQLSIRYTSLPTPGGNHSSNKSPQFGDPEHDRTQLFQGANSRKASIASDGNVVTSVPDDGRRLSLGSTTRNTYDPARDPLGRARQF